jgi:hypothetical protein
MRFQRILTPAVLLVCMALAVVATPTSAGAASAPSLPQPFSAQAGATWLANQFTPQGFIPSQSDPGTADLSATANSILALASADSDPSTAASALSYLESNVNAYVMQDGSDGPGQLALLILDAHALGVDPTSFGGTNLVTRLLATEETSGKNAGLFGTKSQVNNFQAGVYDQGLALGALAGTGDTKGSAIKSAESWLLNQQCADGGWTSYESKNNPCNGSPADFEGPDTNSTALAIEGLAAQGDLSGAADTNAHAFLVHAQDSDGGWGFDPNTTKTPGSTDPDSTALVIQAILALGDSPTKAPFTTNANPVAVLESFQATSGADQGSFTFPGVSGPNLLSTYQAVPAVAGMVFPFNLFVTTTSLPSATVGQRYKAKLHATGGNAPYTWSVEKGFGTLPAGLTLNSSTGTIKGKPTSTGPSTFVVEVTDTNTTGQPQHHNVGWAVLSITTS